jgi:hypothetical protein
VTAQPKHQKPEDFMRNTSNREQKTITREQIGIRFLDGRDSHLTANFIYKRKDFPAPCGFTRSLNNKGRDVYTYKTSDVEAYFEANPAKPLSTWKKNEKLHENAVPRAYIPEKSRKFNALAKAFLTGKRQCTTRTSSCFTAGDNTAAA